MSPRLVSAAGEGPLDDDPEREAAWTVAAVLAGRPKRRDLDGAPAKTHDYDVHLRDGRTIALEVTRLSVPEVVEMWDAIESLKWEFPQLTNSWSISLQAAGRGRGGAQVKRFHARAPALLAVLEQHGVGQFGDILNAHDPAGSATERGAIEQLRRIGARSGGPVGPPVIGPALVLVGTVGPGGPVDGSAVNEGVETATLANLEKLLAAPGDERHLFAWGDVTDPGVHVAMNTFARPDPPRIPPGIDCVWVGLWQRTNLQSHAFTLWRVRPPGPWENLPVPAVRDYALSVVEPETQT